MIIIRCWLEQLFNCAFDRVYFFKNLFNPELINILFDNDKTIPLRFNIQKPTLSTDNKSFKNALNFCLNHLSVSEFIDINLEQVNITEEHTNILFNILINEGNKFPKIYLLGFRMTTLYNYIEQVNQIYKLETGKIELLGSRVGIFFLADTGILRDKFRKIRDFGIPENPLGISSRAGLYYK
ncbi:unnamed protein product [Meloidogyne enterolobii]|uniref:Uncharacterized protein n=1 Tax=Meloidogyne enterolobii TaxID=390850 RepID=A0ACB0YRY0_MELEN